MCAESPPAVRPSKLYGRRKGKALRPGQERLLQTLLPRLAVDMARAPVDLAGLFPCGLQQVWLEIGFGAGEHLVAEASRHPEVAFIGCEPFVNGIAKALRAIEAEKLANIRIHPGDAAALINALPAACLDRVYILYPDPWPKRRQRKRRLISDEMLARLARVMRAGAELRFATDIDDYAGWTLARILRSADLAWPAERAEDWTKPWEGWSPTRYEAKAARAARPSSYLTFVRRCPGNSQPGLRSATGVPR